MFKDLYKNANDKIPTDDAYLRVMKKVGSGQRKNKYSFAKTAALAACFLLTVSMISVYESYQSDKPGEFEIITPPGSGIVTTAEPEPVSSTAPEKAASTKPKAAAQESEIIFPAFESAVQPSVSRQTESITAQPAEPTADASDVSKETVPETKIVKNQGIPESSTPAIARFSVSGSIYTAEDYCRYLGKNIEETVVLPDTFKNESPKEQILSLDTGEDFVENFNDEWTYYFTDDESSVFINTTKKTEYIKNIINNADYTKSNVLGFDAAIFEEDVQKTACLVAEDIGYTVTGIGVSDADFENILISLVK